MSNFELWWRDNCHKHPSIEDGWNAGFDAALRSDVEAIMRLAQECEEWAIDKTLMEEGHRTPLTPDTAEAGLQAARAALKAKVQGEA